MKKGFKKHAEDRSLAIRKELNLAYNDPMDCLLLAKHLRVGIVPLSQLREFGLGLDCLNIFSQGNPGFDEFSAIILDSPHGRIAVYNSFHSPNRINSSLAHEISHVECGHPFLRANFKGTSQLVRELPKEAEEEAEWFSGCLLIPRTALLWSAKKGMSLSEIANHFNTSESMARYRYNVTGVKRQLNALSKFR